MPVRIEILEEVDEDFDHIFDHYAQHSPESGPEVIAGIIQALDILTAHPMIGRPAGRGQRELVIGQGSRGFVALYRYLPTLDAVFVLAVRSQKEAGYKRP